MPENDKKMVTSPDQSQVGARSSPSKTQETLLGLPTDALANVSVEDIIGNAVAVKMMLHYYKQLTAENMGLKNDVNTYRTYADAYEKKKTSAISGGVLAAVSNVPIGISINMMTADSQKNYGLPISLLIVGLALAGLGLYFSLKKD